MHLEFITRVQTPGVFFNNLDTYEHSSLPYGRDLTGDVFRNNLEPIFRVFFVQIMLIKLDMVAQLKMLDLYIT